MRDTLKKKDIKMIEKTKSWQCRSFSSFFLMKILFPVNYSCTVIFMNFALFWTFSIYTNAVFHQPFASSPFFFSSTRFLCHFHFFLLQTLSLFLSLSLSLLTYLFLSVSLCPSPSLTLFISLCHSLYISSLFHFIPSSLSPSSLLSPPLSFDILYILLIYYIMLSDRVRMAR